MNNNLRFRVEQWRQTGRRLLPETHHHREVARQQSPREAHQQAHQGLANEGRQQQVAGDQDHQQGLKGHTEALAEQAPKGKETRLGGGSEWVAGGVTQKGMEAREEQVVPDQGRAASGPLQLRTGWNRMV